VWFESSSINAVNLAKKSATIPEISNFSYGIIFFGAPCISQILMWMFTEWCMCNGKQYFLRPSAALVCTYSRTSYSQSNGRLQSSTSMHVRSAMTYIVLAFVSNSLWISSMLLILSPMLFSKFLSVYSYSGLLSPVMTLTLLFHVYLKQVAQRPVGFIHTIPAIITS